MARKKPAKKAVKSSNAPVKKVEAKSPSKLPVFIIIAVIVVAGLAYAGAVIKAKADKKAAEEKRVAQEQANAAATATAVALMPTPTPALKDLIPKEFRQLLKPVSKREDIPKIHIEEAKALLRTGRALFVDARGVAEYEMAHIKGAISIPAGTPIEKIKEMDSLLKDKLLISYCHGVGCRLSDKTANALFDAGYRKIYIFFGGWNEWTQAKYPVEEYQPPEQFKPLLVEPATAADIKEITLEEAKFLYDKNLANIVDVESVDKFNAKRIDRAISIPHDNIKAMLPNYAAFFDQKPAILYDHGNGDRAKKAAEEIYANNHKKVLVFRNALSEWEKASYPMYIQPK